MGALADMLGSGRSLLAVLAGSITVLAWITSTVGPGWPILGLGLLCLALGASAIAWNGVFMAEVVRLAPAESAGAATAGVLALTFAGVVAGPPVFSLTVGLAGAYGPAYLAVSIFTLIATCLILKVR